MGPVGSRGSCLNGTHLQLHTAMPHASRPMIAGRTHSKKETLVHTSHATSGYHLLRNRILASAAELAPLPKLPSRQYHPQARLLVRRAKASRASRVSDQADTRLGHRPPERCTCMQVDACRIDARELMHASRCMPNRRTRADACKSMHAESTHAS